MDWGQRVCGEGAKDRMEVQEYKNTEQESKVNNNHEENSARKGLSA